MVLHPTVQHEVALAGSPSDRCSSGVVPEVTGGNEPIGIVTDLGQDSGAGEASQAGEASNDLGGRVLLEDELGRLLQILAGDHGGIEPLHDRGGGDTESVLDPGRVAQHFGVEDRVQPVDPGVDASPTGLDQQRRFALIPTDAGSTTSCAAMTLPELGLVSW